VHCVGGQLRVQCHFSPKQDENLLILACCPPLGSRRTPPRDDAPGSRPNSNPNSCLTQMRDGELCSPIASQEQGMEEEERQCSDPEPNSPSSVLCYLRDFSSFGSSSSPESEAESESDAHSHSHPYAHTHSTTSSTSSIDLSFACNHALPHTKLKPKPKIPTGSRLKMLQARAGVGGCINAVRLDGALGERMRMRGQRVGGELREEWEWVRMFLVGVGVDLFPS
jgi:hypothetical protein